MLFQKIYNIYRQQLWWLEIDKVQHKLYGKG